MVGGKEAGESKVTSPAERQKMLKAFSIGPKMVAYLESAGIRTFAELAERDAESLLLQIHVETGVKLNKMGLDALANLVVMAKSDETPKPVL
jgi:hypothetical protein